MKAFTAPSYRLFVLSPSKIGYFISYLCLIVTLFHGALTPAWAQFQKPDISLPSPNAASLGLYGEVPVSLYTGTPNIDIPLHTLQDGKIKVPITLSYHASGVRVNQHPGWVGLNWNLNAGGAITRIVKGHQPDEYPGYGYYFNTTSLTNGQPIPLAGAGLLPIDYEPDEFMFNFLGYSGKFYLDHNKRFVVQSEQNLKVEWVDGWLPTPNNLKADYRSEAIPYYSTFNAFKLTGVDGTVYKFGGVNGIEYSMPFFDQHSGVWTSTTWQLISITTPQGQETIFNYEEDAKDDGKYVADFYVSYLYGFLIFQNNSCTSEAPVKSAGLFGGNLIRPLYLKSITSNQSKITFDRATSNELKFPPHIIRKNFTSHPSDFLDVFPYFFVGSSGQELIDYTWDDAGYIKLLNRLKWKQLTNVKVYDKDNNKIDEWQFVYANNANQRLTLIDINRKSAEPNTNCFQSYNFLYEGVELLPSYLPLLDQTDHWGFLNNNDFNLETLSDDPVIFDNYAVKKNATSDISLLKKGILKRITYPTKGFSEFEFEPHTAYGSVKYNTNGTTELETNGNAIGGLRIKTITHNDDRQAKQLSYEYLFKDTDNSAKSSGILNGKPSYRLLNYFISTGLAQGNIASQYFSTQNTSLISINSSGSHVTYREVKEKLSDGSFTLHKFTNHVSDDGNHFDLYAANPTSAIDLSPKYFPVISQEYQRGKPISLLQVDAANKNILKKNFGYTKTSINPIYRLYTEQFRFCPELYNGIAYLQLATFIDPNVYRLTSEITNDYDQSDQGKVITTATSYTYNSVGLPISITTTVGNKITTTKNKYSDDYSFPIVNCQTYYNDCLQQCGNDAGCIAYCRDLTETTCINSTINSQPFDDQARAILIMKNKGISGALVEQQTWNNDGLNGVIQMVDGYINLYRDYATSAQQNLGLSNVQVYRTWQYAPNTLITTPFNSSISYESLGYLFKFDAATYKKKVVEFIGGYTERGEPKQFSDVNNLITTLTYYDGAKTGLLASKTVGNQQTKYDYKPLVGLSLITDANNLDTKYDYDGFNRLKTVKDHWNNLLQSNAYKIGNSSPGCNTPQIVLEAPVSTTFTATMCALVASAASVSVSAGNSTTLTVTCSACASSTGTTGAPQYVWKAGGQQVGTGSSLVVTPTISTTYSVECSTCTACTSGTVTVSVSGSASCSLVATASPTSVSAGGSSTLSVTCSGCGSSTATGGGTGTSLFTTNFDNDVRGTTFQSDYTDQLKLLSSGQVDGYYCAVVDHTGNSGKVLQFFGESSGLIWEKSVNVTSGTAYTFSMWVRPSYNGTPPTLQKAVQLQVNGTTIASPTTNVANSGCSAGWVQISGTWTATTTGSVPFALRMPTSGGWQNAFAVDDIAIASGSTTGTPSTPAQYVWKVGSQQVGTGSSLVVTPTISTTYSVECSTCTACTSSTVAVTVTGSSSNTSCVYNRVFFLGNSITNIYTLPECGYTGAERGMASTAPDKDFAHLVTAALRASNPNLQSATGGGGTFEIDWQNWNSQTYASQIGQDISNRFPNGQKPDLIVIHLAENVNNNGVLANPSGFASAYNALLDNLIQSAGPNVKIISSNSFWTYQPKVNEIIQNVTSSRGIPMVDLSDIAGSRFYQAWDDWPNVTDAVNCNFATSIKEHPGDRGMQLIADRVMAKIRQGTECGTTTTTTGSGCVVNKVKLTAYVGQNGEAAKAIGSLIEASNDGTTWTTLYTITTAATGSEEVFNFNSAGTPYQYVRYHAGPNSNGALREIAFYNGETKLSGTFIHDNLGSLVNSPDFVIEHAMDNNVNTAWYSTNSSSNSASPLFVGLQLTGCPSTTTSNGACVVNKVKLTAYVGQDGDLTRINGSTIEGSNDGTTWTILHTISGGASAAGQEQVYTFNSTGTAYQFVRYHAGPNSNGALREIAFYNGETKLSGTFIHDNLGSLVNSPDFVIEHAMDGNTNTVWYSKQSGQYSASAIFVGLQLTGCSSTTTTGGACVVNKVKLTAYVGQNGEAVKAIGSTIEASNDGTNWTTLYTVSSAATGSEEVFSFNSAGTSYQYVRYHAGPNSNGALREIAFYNGETRLSGTFLSDNQGVLGAEWATGNAMDGNLGTAWYSAQSGQYASSAVYVGLQLTGCSSTTTSPSSTTLTSVRFYFRPGGCTVCNDRSVGATIQVSQDNTNWTTLVTLPRPAEAWNEVPVNATQAYRYIRYVAAPTGYGELMELEFYAGTTKLSGIPFGAGTTNPDLLFSKAFDEDLGTMWHGETPGTQNYAGLNLGPGVGSATGCVVNKVKLTAYVGQNGEAAKAVGSTIEGSTNGTTWTTLYTITTAATGSEEVFSFNSAGTPYQYVRYRAGPSSNGALREIAFYNGETKLSGTFIHDNLGSLVNSADFVIEHAMDGNTNTAWYSANSANNSASPLFVGLQLTGCSSTTNSPANTTLTSVKFYFRPGCSVCNDRSVGATIQVSQDNTNWTTLATLPRPTDGWNEVAVTNTQAWRYMRYVAASTGYGELFELQFYAGTTRMIGTPFGSPGAAATSTTFDKAFDNDLGTMWHGDVPGTQNFTGIDQGEGVGGACVVNKVKLTAYIGQDGELTRMNGSTIEGSADGITWTTLYTITGGATGQEQVFNFNSAGTPYQYVRYHAGPNSNGALREIAFYNGETKLSGTFIHDNLGSLVDSPDFVIEHAMDGNTNTVWYSKQSGQYSASAVYVGLQLNGNSCH